MGRKMKTRQQFIDEISITSPNVLVLGDFNGVNNRIKVKCSKCGKEWDVIANSLLQGTGCNDCKTIHNKISHKEFLDKMATKTSNIELLSEYITSKDNISCKCNICGNIWDSTPDKLMQGVGCPRCSLARRSNKRRYTHELFLEKLMKNNKDIKVLSTYIDSHSKVKCECSNCGYVWNARANHLLSGHGCPICQLSLGEKRIYLYLIENGISFISQKTFDGLCGNKNGLLPYDFYLPKQNILIEYQGQYHDGSVPKYMQTESDYTLRKEYDKRKREYANAHNIKLLEIWYYDYQSIPRILSNNIDMYLEMEK